MRTDYLSSILKKIAVIDDKNYLATYKFTILNDECSIPFVASDDSMKSYVTAQNFDMDNTTFAVSNITLLNKTLSRFSNDVNITVDKDDLVVTDGKMSASLMLNDEKVVHQLEDLDMCYAMDDYEFSGEIIFDRDFIDNFLALAKNESYSPLDTFTIKWNNAKKKYNFKIGKNIKLKFDSNGTNTLDKLVVILRVGLVYDIFNANKDLVEGCMKLHSETRDDTLVQFRFLSKDNITSVYNLIPEDYEH